MLTQDGIATPVVSRFQLGVLLVHGIGTQPSGDTLVRWGDVLLKTIGRATRNEVVATIERAGPGNRPGEGGAEAAVRFRAGDHAERWLLSEGWWADSFPAPSYRELVSWSVRALPWSIATHIAERYWQAASPDWSRAKIVALARALGQLLGALALAPVSVGLLGLAVLLGAVPVPQIRTLIRTAQSTLTATVGDSLAFVESPVRAALIRTRILERLERLKQLCERIVIVAHSQGAAAVLDALGGIVEPDKGGEAAPASHPAVDTLVTFGAGTNQLASQKVLSAGLPEKIGVNPVSRSVAALVAAAGLSAWLYWNVRHQQTTVYDILEVTGLLLLTWIVFSLVVWAIVSLARRWQAAHERSHRIVVWTLAPVFLVGMGLLIWCAEVAHLPMGPVSSLVVALLVLGVSMHLILSREMKTIVTAPVRKPLGLVRWVDLYASADPVPNGPTRTIDVGTHESIRIWNLGSMFADHTAYWDNRDGFVLRVVRVCAETAQSPWTGALPRETHFVDDRAAWRVGFLQLARRSTHVIWLAVGALLWTRHQVDIPVPFDLPSWFPPAAARLALLVALITLAVWATSRILRWLWSWWVRAEQEAVLAHDQPEREQMQYLLVAMGMVIWLLLIPAFVLVRDGPRAVLELIPTDPNELTSALVTIFGCAVVSMFVLLGLNRPPDASAPPSGGSIH